MEWKLSRRGDKYKIWSTVRDSYITEWISREEALEVWYDVALIDFQKNVIKQYFLFPHMCADRDKEGYIIDETRNEQYCQWIRKLSNIRDADEYWQCINEQYEKIVKELDEGIAP